MNWRERIPQSLKTHLEKEVAESVKHRGAYESAIDPGNAQLWVVIAKLSKDIDDLNLKVKTLKSKEKKVIKKDSPKKN